MNNIVLLNLTSKFGTFCDELDILFTFRKIEFVIPLFFTIISESTFRVDHMFTDLNELCVNFLR